MPRWSKLQREIYNLIDGSLNFQIHCSVYRMQSQFGGTDLPRYWITLDKDIIFDYPKQFLNNPVSHIKGADNEYTVGYVYPYMTDISDISDVIREYIETPLSTLLSKGFTSDKWGITDILKAADRRLGKTRLMEHFTDCQNDAVLKVLRKRVAQNSNTSGF